MKIKSLWQLIFILIILYAFSSMNILIIAREILPSLPQGYFLIPQVLGYFSLISFGLAAFLSAYHIIKMFHKDREG